MNHFSAEGWADFARGMTAPEQRTLMQRHLDNGCDQCLKRYETWRTVLAIGIQEPAYRPPADAVRSAKAAYAAERPARWFQEAARIAQLVFDSFLQPAPAGIRNSMTSSARQLLYETEPFVIDLRVESEPARKRIRLMGQVMNSKKPDKEIEGIEVVLLKSESLIVRTTANPSGEFGLEFTEEEGLQLFISVRRHNAMEIVLPGSK